MTDIHKKAIGRLSQYKNTLNRLKSVGFIKVFSRNLADAAGVTPFQVRKDFSIYGIYGNKKGGYIVDELIEEINGILGKQGVQRIVIVGVGNIGRALLNYKGFEKDGVEIVAGFDNDPLKYAPEAKIPVLPIGHLTDFIRTNNIKVGVISVPDSMAQTVLDLMIDAGIKGVLNFAPIRLNGGKDCVIHNVNLSIELETVIYFVNGLKDKKNR